MRKINYLPDVYEFETEGFVKSSRNKTVLNRLRSQYGTYLRMFNAGCNNSIGRSGAKYGSYDIFGNKICYYYDIRKESEFVDFLTRLFYENNPDPDEEIRKVFTRILHLHKLHWLGCRHSGKYRYDV
jgi:hypothetical protein